MFWWRFCMEMVSSLSRCQTRFGLGRSLSSNWQSYWCNVQNTEISLQCLHCCSRGPVKTIWGNSSTFKLENLIAMTNLHLLLVPYSRPQPCYQEIKSWPSHKAKRYLFPLNKTICFSYFIFFNIWHLDIIFVLTYLYRDLVQFIW